MDRASSVSLDHCSAEQLKTLLELATATGPAGGALGLKAADVAALRRLLTELCRGQGESGDLLLETVCDPEAPLEVLRGLKELAKRLVTAAPGETQHQAATILYHAAIAGGLAHHGVNISSRPLEARLRLYEDLAAAFAGEPLGTLFLGAVEAGVR